MYGLGGLEVGGRVVEREVAVLADAHERDVDRVAGEDARPRARHSAAGSAASPSMKWNAPGCTRSHEPLAQVLAEARGVRVGQPDVLVEVEEDGARPVDARRFHEAVEELELRGARWPR